jgi:hypothetical protein
MRLRILGLSANRDPFGAGPIERFFPRREKSVKDLLQACNKSAAINEHSRCAAMNLVFSRTWPVKATAPRFLSN